jgi:hypothetical protein
MVAVLSKFGQTVQARMHYVIWGVFAFAVRCL